MKNKKKMATQTKKPQLTEIQQAVFNALCEDERASLHELVSRTGASLTAVHAAVGVLEALGMITREPGRARSIRVVEARA